MAISFPLNIPSSPSIKEIRFRMNSQTGMHRSSFTGHQYVTVWPGQWWEVDVTLPKMERAEAEEWNAFFASLNGQEGYFRLGDPDGTTARGTAGGTPLVNGASQTGQDLITDGWDLSAVVLKAGDYIQIDDTLYKVLEDVTSDGSGNATLSLFPKIRVAHDTNSTIVVSSAKGLFRLADNVSGWSSDDNRHYTITFSAVEYF